MQVLPFVSLLFYIIIIVCKAKASCPCHIPCTGKTEICTCYGPCGDDGYGCKSNGEDYNFLNQVSCRENEWIVSCIREASCPAGETLDDTNPYAAYELEAQKNNILEDSFDDINDDNSASFSWFGGNWFDFWGQNDGQFFNKDNMDMENMKNIKSNKYDDNDITIDNKDYEPVQKQPQSAQRTLQTSQSKFSSKPIMDDLGRNEAGYKIIALPLYILIICIVSSSILGMLMCAGFVYCGLHCCCPLPQSSPTLTSTQRSNTIEMTRVLQSLTLGGGYKQSHDNNNNNNNNNYSVYHRMRNALHNPTADENSSILSNDEYVDSEDDKKINNNNNITRGNIDDIDHDDYDFKYDYDKEPSALIGKHDSDIDNDSDDSMIRQLGNLIETRLLHDNIEQTQEDDGYDNDNEPELEDSDNEGELLINDNLL